MINFDHYNVLLLKFQCKIEKLEGIITPESENRLCVCAI